jgi:hypothetical protein
LLVAGNGAVISNQTSFTSRVELAVNDIRAGDGSGQFAVKLSCVNLPGITARGDPGWQRIGLAVDVHAMARFDNTLYAVSRDNRFWTRPSPAVPKSHGN